jgi:transposase
MNIRYRVELNEGERAQLTAMLSGGKHAARKLKRAQILLAADAGIGDEAIADSISVGGSTVYRTKWRFVEGNLDLALSEEARPGAARKLSGKETALLVATVCSNPPEGRKRWTLDLLAGQMVQLTEHDGLSRETVPRRLAEDDLKPWLRKMWCIPEVNGTYVARMEDVLDLYADEADPRRPVVCFDESPTQLIGEVREPIPAAPGQPERYDFEYKRNGTANLFVFLDVHKSWQHVKVTDQRTACDFAECMGSPHDLCKIVGVDGSGLGCSQPQFWHSMPWGRPPQQFWTDRVVTPKARRLPSTVPLSTDVSSPAYSRRKIRGVLQLLDPGAFASSRGNYRPLRHLRASRSVNRNDD